MSPTTNAAGNNAPDAPPPRMPRIAFKKSRSGCRRCKERKVKCDEAHPTCHNCVRHRVACEYVAVPAKRANGRAGERRRGASSTPGASSSAGSARRRRPSQEEGGQEGEGDEEEEEEEEEDEGLGLGPEQRRLLELRLLHHYVGVVAHTFSAADNPVVFDMWTKLVVRTAFEHAFLLNTLLAFAALHVVSTTSRAAAGGFAPIEDTSLLPAELVGAAAEACAGVDAERAYRVYLDLAFRQQREAIKRADIGPETANALLFSSILLSYQALHVDRGRVRRRRRRRARTNGADADAAGAGRGEDDEPDSQDESEDGKDEEAYCPPLQWLKMVRGIQQTTMPTGVNITHDAVVRFLAHQGGEPNFLDPASLANPAGLEPFGALLDYDAHPEPRDGRVEGEEAGQAEGGVDEVTRDAYERALMYVGTVYLGIRKGEDDRVLFRRIIGLGFVTPERFIALVEAGRPRALVIVAYHLSMASRLGHHWLFRGVAEREVRGLRGLVPPEWSWAMEWATNMIRAGTEESRKAGERAVWRPPLPEGV